MLYAVLSAAGNIVVVFIDCCAACVSLGCGGRFLDAGFLSSRETADLEQCPLQYRSKNAMQLM